MKVWVISDMHNQYRKLKVPKGIDFCICSGDATNHKSQAINYNEVLDFFDWIKGLPFDVIMTPGNHDTSMQASKKFMDIPSNLMLLKHEFVKYKGLNIFGSPYTPSFGVNWAFNVKRQRIDNYWKEIPKGLDILITHGPPKGIMDYTKYKREKITSVGDNSLLRHIVDKRPRYHIFGHLHDEKGIYNSGIFRPSNYPNTVFVNASCVNLEHQFKYNGIILDIKKLNVLNKFLNKIKY